MKKIKCILMLLSSLLIISSGEAQLPLAEYKLFSDNKLKAKISVKDTRALVTLGFRKLNKMDSLDETFEGLNYLKQADFMGNNIATYLMWRHYTKNEFITPDYIKAVNWTYPNPEKIIYWNKRLVKIDIEWGSLEAAMDLALIYMFDDEYGYINEKQAHRWFEYSFNRALSIAEFTMNDYNRKYAKQVVGLLYYTGLGVEKNIEKAKNYGEGLESDIYYRNIKSQHATFDIKTKQRLILKGKDFGYHSEEDLNMAIIKYYAEKSKAGL